MKKTIFVTLLAAMMLFAFTACNDSPDVGYQVGARGVTITVAENEGEIKNDAELKNNAEKAQISCVGNVITITADKADLKECLSDNTAQNGSGNNEKHLWVGVLIDTKLESIVDAKLTENGTPATLAQTDADEAKGVGGNASEFVLWVKADDMTAYPRTIQLADKEGKFLTAFSVVLNITDSAAAEEPVV